MEVSSSSNITVIQDDGALQETAHNLLPQQLPLNSKAVSTTEDSDQNGNSASDTAACHPSVCYLANGNGQIDRLNLVLPLTTNPSAALTLCTLSMLSTSSPFSSSHLIESSDISPADLDRTPINSEKGFSFSPTEINPLTHSESFSSCRTVDSGTESICSDSVEDYMMNDLAADRILKFFASDNSKSTRYVGRRLNQNGGLQQTSTDFNDEDEDAYSDESTLSECSVSTPDYSLNETITPESVVAAIDKIITPNELVTDDKEKSSNDDKTKDGVVTKHIDGMRVNLPKTEDNFVLSSELKNSDNLNTDKSATKKSEIDDDFDYDAHCDNNNDDHDDCLRVPLIRSTSLKTGKTPPGTPRGKKIVRFADALGLDLESVRHIVDDVPYVPPLAAFKGLSLDDDDKRWLFDQHDQSPQLPSLLLSVGPMLKTPVLSTKPNLRVLFCQPSSDPSIFLDRIRSHKICLENCLVTGPAGPSNLFTITCLIRVLNIGFEKSVALRFTTNEWLTYTDVIANYIPNSCDGFSDKFTVTFYVAVNSNGHQTMMPGQRLLFALKYLANGSQEFWDNNMGLNYALIYQRS